MAEQSSSRWRAFALWSGIGLLHVAVFLAVHHELLTGKLFLGWDAVNESWGDMAYVARALGDGALPLWNPYERGGYAFLADPQTSILYPPHWPIHGLALALGHGPWLALARTLVHIMIAGIGMHVLLRHLGCHPAARWVGSIAFMLCGRVAKSKDSAGLWSPVWMPVVLYGVLRVVEKPTLARGAVLGGLVALMFYSGYPPNVFRAAILIGLIALVLIVQRVRQCADRGQLLRRLAGALALGGVVAVLLCLPGIVATLGELDETVRAGLSRREVLYSSLTWRALQEFFIPRVGLERAYGMLYLGVLPGVFALLALMRLNALRAALLVGAGVFFVLACGSHSAVLPFLVDHVPGFGMWRISEQYLFGTLFSLAILAGLGAHDVLTRVERRHLVGGGLILLVWGIFAALHWQKGLPTPHRAGMTLISKTAVLFVVLSGAVLLMLRSPRWRVVAMAAGVPLMLFDMRTQLEPTYRIGQPPPDLRRDASLTALPGLSDGQRFMDDGYFRWRAAARTGLGDLSGRYNTMVTSRWKAFSDAAWGDPRLMGHGAVRWIAGRKVYPLLRRQRRALKRKGGVYEVRAAAPYAFHRRTAQRVKSAKAALATLRKSAPGAVAVVEFDAAPEGMAAILSASDDGTTAVERVGHGWGEIDLRIVEPAAGVVVVNEAYAADWVATDGAGRALPIVRANHLFMGVVVGPAVERITLRYRPTAVYAALGTSGLTVLLLLGWAWRRRRGRG